MHPSIIHPSLLPSSIIHHPSIHHPPIHTLPPFLLSFLPLYIHPPLQSVAQFITHCFSLSSSSSLAKRAPDCLVKALCQVSSVDIFLPTFFCQFSCYLLRESFSDRRRQPHALGTFWHFFCVYHLFAYFPVFPPSRLNSPRTYTLLMFLYPKCLDLIWTTKRCQTIIFSISSNIFLSFALTRGHHLAWE